jgi:hypothetical protein
MIFWRSVYHMGLLTGHVFLQILGSRGDMEAKIEQTTRQKIEELNRNVQANKEKAMQKLLKLVCDIKPELHENYIAQ